jgi:hypothetical protein
VVVISSKIAVTVSVTLPKGRVGVKQVAQRATLSWDAARASCLGSRAKSGSEGCGQVRNREIENGALGAGRRVRPVSPLRGQFNRHVDGLSV